MPPPARHSQSIRLLRSLVLATTLKDFTDAVQVSKSLLPEPDADLLLQELLWEARQLRSSCEARDEAYTRQLWILAAAAVCALSEAPQTEDSRVFDAAFSDIFLPLLSLTAELAGGVPGAAVQQLIAEVICRYQRWDIAHIALSSATQLRPPSRSPRSSTAAQESSEVWLRALASLPRHQSIMLASCIIEGAVRVARQQDQPPSGNQAAPTTFLALASGPAFHSCLRMLGQGQLAPSDQQSLARSLIPACFLAAEAAGVLAASLECLLRVARWVTAAPCRPQHGPARHARSLPGFRAPLRCKPAPVWCKREHSAANGAPQAGDTSLHAPSLPLLLPYL